MTSQKENKTILIRQETYGALSLIENKMLGKFNKLMNEKEASQAAKTGYFMNEPMPFIFLFAPYGKRNQENIKSAKKGERVDLIIDNKVVGYIITEDVFPSKNFESNITIFGSNTISEKKEKMGEYAISGEVKIFDEKIVNALKQIEELKQKRHIKKITALMMSVDPLHRAHERLMRMTIDKADLIVVFLIRSHKKDSLNYKIKKKALQYFSDNFLPKDKVMIVPFENTFLFTNHINPELECILAYNFGANKIVLGQMHGGIGMYYDENGVNTALDRYKKDLPIEILIMPEYVYCTKCNAIVSNKSCPHGQHNHIKFHQKTLKTLLYSGIVPPTILMRSEISALILSELFPNRFENLQEICDNLFVNDGIIQEKTYKDFYKELANLYQINALT